MLWIKTFHILFVISWFAGLFYLPRIYVNLAQNHDATTTECLLGMARRLYRFMTPLGILAVVLGLWLYIGYGLGMGQGWMHVKLAAVAGLGFFHMACARILRTFEAGQNTRSHRYYRWFNEIPVLLLLIVLVMVVIRPL